MHMVCNCGLSPWPRSGTAEFESSNRAHNSSVQCIGVCLSDAPHVYGVIQFNGVHGGFGEGSTGAHGPGSVVIQTLR